MAAVRKDNRGIVLRKGESQDKNGRYRYRYYDDMQQGHDVYSWTLRPEDATPEGKKAGLSLRELEEAIAKDVMDSVKTWEGNITLNKLIEEYFEQQKAYWAPGTVENYKRLFVNHIKPSMGKKKVTKITADNVEAFYTTLVRGEENSLHISTVSTVDNIISPAFEIAVKRNLIRNNPADGALRNVKKKNPKQTEGKHALEERQQQELLQYIKETPKYTEYYPLFYVLAWTGCRINELLALTWYDVDFKNEIIHIERNLSYKPIDGHYRFIIREPKTKAGFREIPMLADVKRVLLEMRKESGSKIITVGQKPHITVKDTAALIFKNRNNNFHAASNVEGLLRKIVRDYNRAKGEELTNVTPHSFRHSFTCWLCENVQGENSMDDVKYIQSILGHKDAGTTLNIYSELRKGNAVDKHEALKKRASGK